MRRIRTSSHCMIILACVLASSGCRTYGVVSRIFLVPLNKRCPSPVDCVAPSSIECIQSQHQSIVQHMTTGNSAIPAACSPSLGQVAGVAITSSTGKSASISSRDEADFEGFSMTPIDVVASASLELSLADAAHRAISSNELVKRDADFVSGTSSILAAPAQVISALDPSISDSGFLFGQRGRAAALSDFDGQFQTSTIWGRNEAIQNSRFLSGGILPGNALLEDTAQFNASLSKNLRSGGRVSLFHTWDYDASNRDDLLFPSVYRGTIGAEIRQPLLAGAGRNYTDVAGPPGDQLRGVTGVSQGYLIARNNTTIAQLELKKQVANILNDVEVVYWQLSAARASLQTAIKAKKEVLNYLDLIEARAKVNSNRVSSELMTSKDLSLEAELLVEESESQAQNLNQRLCRLMAISPSLVPEVIPTDLGYDAKVVIDLESSLESAVSRRPEIQQQQLHINNIDYQIRAAQSLLLPQLDGIARYQVNGFGDHLSSQPIPGPDQAVQSAYDNLFQGDHTGWQLGFQFTHTFGRRLERTRIRNLRLQGQKERIILKEQINDIEHELSTASRELASAFRMHQLVGKRLELASLRVNALKARYDADDESVDITNIAESQLAEARLRIASFEARSKYAQAITRIHRVSGGMMPEHGIQIVAR